MNRSLIGIGAAVLGVILGIFLLMPKVNAVRQVTIDKKASLEVVRQKEARIDSLNNLKTAFANQPEEVDSILRSLPLEPEIPDVLVTIESMTRDAGLTLDAISPSVDKTKQLVSVSLSGESDLPALERFFDLVAKNRRPMSLAQVSMNKGQSGNALIYNLVINFAYITEPTTEASPDASGNAPSSDRTTLE